MAWTIEGSDGQPIGGDAHVPDGEACGAVLIVHGFLGYKDYGMFPFLAASFAGAGFVAHRFNLSHSGMTNDTASFERPDLFERDTWSRQVFDVGLVMERVARGELPGAGLPIVLLGHSRGGVTVLLTAGRRFRDGRSPLPDGVITLAAPSGCARVSSEAIESFEARGYQEVVSNRTGQALRVGRAWLEEQRANPDDHDLLSLAGAIACPVLVAHGTDDPTVPPSCAEEIAGACRDGTTLLIEGGDHVLGTPNPFPRDGRAGPALGRFTDVAIEFAKRAVAEGR